MAEAAAFTLLHTNDVHGRIEELARAATLVGVVASPEGVGNVALDDGATTHA